MELKPKLLRITTVPISLNVLLKGQLSYIRSNGFDVVASSAQGPEIIEIIEREGVPHYVIPLTRKITPFQDIWCLWKLILFIRRERFTIVHSHTPKAGLIGMLAAWFCRVPHRLHTVAGMPLMETRGFKRKLLKWVELITYRSATRVYPNSFRLRDFIVREIYASREKLHVIGRGSSNGIDLTYFQVTTEVEKNGIKLLETYGIKKDHLIITFIGRIVADKGINELIEAFEQVNEGTEKKTKLLLVGPYEDDLNPISSKAKTFIEEHPDIISVGFQSDIRPYLYISDIFAFPSYREGFPNVVLQACAMGVPCVASDINGCNEIILNERTGLLIPTKSVAELVAALKRLISDEDFRKRLAEEARSYVRANFDQQYVWKEIIKEYKKHVNV
ncbi:Alpha-1,3-N-acetylgalactosamine transferase PglA [Fulvivirga imtechensis AK7]|uniref:Alpha-1,3-N-acetylgalactosamine transferase PglA n=1 Tax=Fulvivirga imtechensis AK7 TaxID=1237149 RepID=L8JSZ5_9BACT|nr:glycosyltransferase family 4 protein [Fulvivirga imtechensis]ELR70614.1 Alpha-1,3-N-acetylgalactosamine transferase PglA [Fulvivirga imtechensis AK7]